MKRLQIARSLLFCTIGLVAQFQGQVSSQPGAPNVIRVHLQAVEGFGPFEPGFALNHPSDTSAVNEWHDTWARVKNIPADLKDVQVGRLEMQIAQEVFHSLHAGLLKREFALLWIRMAHADTSNLTTQFVDQEVSYVVGIDSIGRRVIIFDADHDHDFHGEKRIILSAPDTLCVKAGSSDTVGYIEPQEVTFDFWDGEQVRRATTKIAIRRPDLMPKVVSQWSKGAFVLGSATYEHREGRFQIGTRYFDCYVNNMFNGGVYDGRTSNLVFCEAGEMSDRLNLKKESLRTNDIVKLNNIPYSIEALTTDGTELTLRRAQAPGTSEGLTIGSIAKDFNSTTTHSDSIHLKAFRGKYVLLDFWGSWCAGCRFEIPYLKDVYHVLTDKGLSVIGIAFDDSAYLDKFIKDYGVVWPQILARGPEDPLLNAYAIRQYPAFFLIDPRGRILSHDVPRGERLAPELFKYVGGEQEFRDYVLTGNVEFDYRDETVRRVEVAGDFNNWTPIPLYKYEGRFRRRIELKPGRYQYKFLVDNAWTMDPLNTATINTPENYVNNVLVVK